MKRHWLSKEEIGRSKPPHNETIGLAIAACTGSNKVKRVCIEQDPKPGERRLLIRCRGKYFPVISQIERDFIGMEILRSPYSNQISWKLSW